MAQRLFSALLTSGLIVSGGMTLNTAQASGTLFKCTSANGATQYAQRAVSGQKCSLMRVDGTPASALEVQQKLADQRNASRAAASRAATPATTAAATPTAPAKPAPASAEECQKLNQARTTLEQGGRVYEFDDKGERSYLTEEQRLSRIQEYQNTAKTRCT